MLLSRDEIALLDLRHEAVFASGHPLFAANMAAGRIALEARMRLPRKDVPIVLYDAGEGLVAQAADRFKDLGYTDVRQLEGGPLRNGTIGWTLAKRQLDHGADRRGGIGPFRSSNLFGCASSSRTLRGAWCDKSDP